MKPVSAMILLACAASAAGYANAGTTAAAAPRQLDIAFEMLANGQPVRCGQPLASVGSDARRATLRDARFYVYDVALIGADGNRTPLALDINDWQNEQVALLDFEDASAGCSGGTPATNMVVSGTVPAGQYSGLAFTIGVPPASNHTSTELEGAPLDIAAMGWSWQAGRKFTKIEIDPEGGVTKADGSRAAAWYVHLGATGCTGNPVTGETVSCRRANRVPVVMERFDPAGERVVLDLDVLFEATQVSADRGGAVGCMSGPTDPECKGIFERLGLSLEEGTPLAAGRSPAFGTRPKP